LHGDDQVLEQHILVLVDEACNVVRDFTCIVQQSERVERNAAVLDSLVGLIVSVSLEVAENNS
jgi:hypothetical protein